MKVAALLSTMCLVVSLAFSGGLSNDDISGRLATAWQPAVSEAPIAQIAPAAPAASIEESPVADQFTILSFI